MSTVLRFPRALRLLSFRSAATPPAAPERPAQGSPQPEPAAHLSADVVNIADRCPPGVYPWCPSMPWVGALMLGAALTSSTAAHLAADLSLLPGRITVAAFSPWSA